MGFKMLQLVSVLCVAIIFSQVVSGRPSLSKQNDENDGFGYKYGVSHYPGSSTVHLNFGKSKHDHRKSTYLPNNEEKNGYSLQNSPYQSYPPAHSKPNRYLAEDGAKPIAKSELPIYDPEINGDSHKSYASPYDSDNQQSINGYGESYEPRHYQGPHTRDIPHSEEPSRYQHSDSNLPTVDVLSKDVHQPSYQSQQSFEPNHGRPISHEAPISQHDVDVQLQPDRPDYEAKGYNPSYPQQHSSQYAVPQHSSGPTVDVLSKDVHQPSYQSQQSFEPNHGGPVPYEDPIYQHDVGVQLQPDRPDYEAKGYNPSYPQHSSQYPVPQHSSGPNYASQGPHPANIPQHDFPLQSPDPNLSVKAPHPSFGSQHDIDEPLNLQNPQFSSHAAPSQHNVDVPLQPADPNLAKQSLPSYPLTQHDIGVPPTPISSNYALEESYPQSYSPEIINNPLSNGNPDLGVKSLNTGNEYLGGNPSDSVHTPPVGPKYVLIPSGPAYTRDSFSTEIIHASPKQSVKTVPVSPGYSSKTVAEDIANPPPISHAFRLPYNLAIPATVPENLPIESAALSSEIEHIEDLPAIAPLSHSTRLLIPTAVVSSKPSGVKTVPTQLSSLENSPITAPHTAGLESPEAIGSSTQNIPPISHSFRLNLPHITPGVLPDVPDTKHENIGSLAPEISPISHSFRLNIPHITPGILPDVPDTKPEDVGSSAPDISPVSHSFRLNLPHVTPGVLPDVPDTRPEDVGSSAPDISPVSHSFRLNLPQITPGVLPDVPDTKPEDVGSSAPDISPLSHSFRLNVPQITPGVLPDVPDTKPEDSIHKSALEAQSVGIETPIPPVNHSFKHIPSDVVPGDLPNIPDIDSIGDYDGYFSEINEPYILPPIFDSVRLPWPSTLPDDDTYDDNIAKVGYFEENSHSDDGLKSLDSTHLAQETLANVK